MTVIHEHFFGYVSSKGKLVSYLCVDCGAREMLIETFSEHSADDHFAYVKCQSCGQYTTGSLLHDEIRHRIRVQL